ncbi:MAG TPA: diacylglycerol kinase family protein [Acidobacteriaceae bacterium]|nr:diacylglycerol kinase family protein [Acidobacteriaceae bacterium]
MREILLFVNPVFAGRNGRILPPVLRVFEQAGVRVDVQETAENRAAGAQAALAVERGYDAIVACGGDGTAFDVLQGLAGSPSPLGILPLGTGNVLAQNLKIPRDPVAAARWLLTARPRPVQLGKITCCLPGGTGSWFFAMSAGMGVHAELMAAAHRSGKAARGRLAYFAAGLDLLLHHPLQLFEMETTSTQGKVDRRRASEAIALRVAELNFWRPGGGLDLSFLRLASVEEGSRWRLARACLDAVFRSPGARNRHSPPDAPARYEDVLRVVCRPISGFDYQVPLAIEADGEVLEGTCAVIEMAGVSVQMLSAAP